MLGLGSFRALRLLVAEFFVQICINYDTATGTILFSPMLNLASRFARKYYDIKLIKLNIKQALREFYAQVRVE